MSLLSMRALCTAAGDMSHSPTSSEAWELRGDNTGWSTSEQDVAKQKDAEQGALLHFFAMARSSP